MDNNIITDGDFADYDESQVILAEMKLHLTGRKEVLAKSCST